MLKHLLRWSITTHYLDDFIRIVPCELASTLAQDEKDYFDLTNTLGIPRNPAKDRCGTTVEVLGIEIDTSTFEARLRTFAGGTPRYLSSMVSFFSTTSTVEQFKSLQTLVHAVLEVSTTPRKTISEEITSA
jgi:hypothetical protein